MVENRLRIPRKMKAKNLPYVSRWIERFEQLIGREEFIGLVSLMYELEGQMPNLTERERTFITEEATSRSLRRLRVMREEGRENSDFYWMLSGNLAAYLMNVTNFFVNPQEYQNSIALNMALLYAETQDPVVRERLAEVNETRRDSVN